MIRSGGGRFFTVVKSLAAARISLPFYEYTRLMGEYYVAANLDKRQYLDPKNLGIDSSLSAVTNGIFARMVAWLINDGARYPGAPVHYCGWAADRVALIGDEGPHSQVWEEIKAEDEQTDWENITLEVLKSIGEAEPLDRLELWHDGWLTDDGEVVTSSDARAQLRGDRQNS